MKYYYELIINGYLQELFAPFETKDQALKVLAAWKEDGLAQSWAGECVFCNPPYGRAIGDWVKKCYEEHIKHNITVVMLIPARTDTTYFHKYIYNYAELRFIKGRLKFNDGKQGAPFPSMLVIYR